MRYQKVVNARLLPAPAGPLVFLKTMHGLTRGSDEDQS
jgi:hypothetical protein